MRKPTICIGENKGADQLRGNREADQRLCFRYSDSTFPPLLIPKFSSSWVSSMTVQAGLCWTWSETTLLVFPQGGSNIKTVCLSPVCVACFWLMLTGWLLWWERASHLVLKVCCRKKMFCEFLSPGVYIGL